MFNRFAASGIIPRVRPVWRVCPVLLAVTVSVAAAQTPGRSAAAALSAVPTLASVAGSGLATEVTFTWTTTAAPGDQLIAATDFQPLNRFEPLARRSVAPAFVRERAPELSDDRLVVMAVDAAGREVAWQQVYDPRIVRAEASDLGQPINGQTLFRPRADLVVTLPDALAAAAVRVFAARWNGTEFLLELLGELPWTPR